MGKRRRKKPKIQRKRSNEKIASEKHKMSLRTTKMRQKLSKKRNGENYSTKTTKNEQEQGRRRRKTLKNGKK